MRTKIGLAIGALAISIAPAASAKNDDLYDRKIDVFRAYPQRPPPPPPQPESARTDGFGATVTGFGGLATADSRLHTGEGLDTPDPLRDARLGVEGERAVGGFTVDIFTRLSDVRVGFGSLIAFGDAFRLDAFPPLANGFTVQPGSTIIASVHAFLGRQFRLGPVLPYVDLCVGGSILTTAARLYHPNFGFLGATQHSAYRFVLAPRGGVAIPLGSIFFIDAGVRGELLGFLRVTGYAGLGTFFGF